MKNKLPSKSIKVVFPRKYTIGFVIFLLPILASFLFQPTPNRALQADILYTKSLEQVERDLRSLRAGAMAKQPVSQLRQLFLRARLSYKKLAVLSEYYNTYETKLLNGPAVSWVEESNPDMVIPPHGYQALELLLFPKLAANAAQEIVKEIDFMLGFTKKMQEEQDRIYKFKDPTLWASMQSACIRLASLGITGFDAPASGYSLKEARSSIGAIRSLLNLFRDEWKGERTSLAQNTQMLLQKADDYLLAHPSFDNFNRFIYIRDYLNPLYRSFVTLGNSIGLIDKTLLQPINASALSLFDSNFLNVEFFSPPAGYRPTAERMVLGKKLFFDPLLSGTGTRSCASCHRPELAFTDGVTAALSLDSITYLTRNTPTLWNSALQTRQFYDSRTDILENQLDEVVHNAREMKGSLKSSIGMLKRSPEYAALFKKAYPAEADPFSAFNIANAISSYVRSLIGLNSRFDRAIRSKKNLLTNSEMRGFNLFAGKAKCATCHFLPLFSGLVPPGFVETESEVIGVPRNKTGMAEIDPDPGRNDFTHASIHLYSFKIPSLRNIALTAPYMHNGVYQSLEEVMDFYNKGGGAGLGIVLDNQTLPTEKLNLSAADISDIIAFLHTLTDTTARSYQAGMPLR